MALATAGAGRLAAQQLDVIRGQVTGPDSGPIEGALVTATGAGGTRRTASSGRDGRFTVTFPASDADYVLSFAALGFGARTLTLRRSSEDNVFVANVRLQRVALTVDSLTVRGRRPIVDRDLPTPDVGGTETPMNPWNLASDQIGVLAAMAASVPGVQLITGPDGAPDGFSVLGLPPDQNRTTLGGLALGAASVPRDAPVRSTVATSPYDVSRGGFSGAQQNLAMRPPGNLATRGASLFSEAPQLQWLDRAGSGPGRRYTNLSLGGMAAGALRPDRLFYDISAQLSRRWSDLRTLVNAGPAGLAAEGIAADSIARLQSILLAAGVPLFPARATVTRATEQGLLLGTLTFAPQESEHALAFTLSGSWNRQAPVGLPAISLPSAGAERRDWQAALLTRHSAYLGGGLLTETSLGLTRSRTRVDPFMTLPAASVLVGAALPDGSRGLRLIPFAGYQGAAGFEAGTMLELRQALSWFSRDTRHRLQLTTELRRESWSRDLAPARSGLFTFRSLEDLAAGVPATFTRALVTPARHGGLLTGALALGDTWRVGNDLTLQYGLRVDANRYDARPELNSALLAALNVRNDRTPNRADLSPRVGAAWSYGSRVAGLPRPTLRAGVGVFQNRPAATLMQSALASTGLPGSATRISCADSAAPPPDWPAWADDPAAIPTTCTGGAGGTFSDAAPDVALLPAAFASPRALRSSLQWSAPVWKRRVIVTIEATWSRTTRQARTVDLNLRSTPAFTLADEDGRPVFADPADIATASGAIAPGAARIASAFGRVAEPRSDLRADAAQLALRLAPAARSFRFTWSLAWVHAAYREQVGGFSSTAGDPFSVTNARSGLDVRHQFAFNAVFAIADWVRVGVFGQLRSGSPFTPMVAGDINGDGYSNDRAFVYAPGGAPDSALATGMNALLTRGSSAARACLRRQLGSVAGHNSCVGPWTASSTIALTINPTRLGLSQRWAVSVQLSNALGAADLLLHGQDALRGWGQPARPDATLLHVRGFDPAARRFRYEVNPRFGATAPALSAARSAARLTIMARVDLAPVRELQSLHRMMAQGRNAPGERATAPVLRSVYVTGGLPNPLAQVLFLADTLRLTPAQADSVARMNAAYVGRLDSIWGPVAAAHAAAPDRYDRGEAARLYAAARSASLDALGVYGHAVRGLLTRQQRRRLPVPVARLLDPGYLASIRAGTVGSDFGGPLNLPGSMPGIGGAGTISGR